MKTHTKLPLAVLLVASTALPVAGAEPGPVVPGDSRIDLRGASIVVDGGQPDPVLRRVEDLREYLRELTGTAVPLESTIARGPGTRIVAGRPLVEEVLGKRLRGEDLGDEGFLFQVDTALGRTCVLVAGAAPAGTRFALAALMKAIRIEGDRVFLDAPVDRVSRPAFARRGMHLNGWPIGYPHGFRAWREEDWKRYLDVLTLEGVNLFYLWPFLEIMPVPFSPEDEEYLRECRRVVDYAQKRQGMEVWIMQCTNRVARDDCGVRDPRRRPYWRASQEDLDPGNPDGLRRILESREAMYRILDNVDGVCNIDSDPGYFENSPLTDYLRVLRGCRAALDRWNVHRKDAKLVHWMWMGWGHASGQVPIQRETIRLLEKELPEPWGLVCGMPGYLPLCRELGVLGKTVYLPYGVIEDEPSYPTTNVSIQAVRNGLKESFPLAKELAGAMGNVQTPLLQFPHVHAYLGLLRDPESASRSEQEVLLETARLLYPESADLIADSWMALREKDPAALGAAAGRLDAAVRGNRLGRAGAIGRHLFPDRRIAAEILLSQLKHRAARERLLEAAPAGAVADGRAWEELVKDDLDGFLAWELANGWQALWGWGPPAGLLGGLLSDPRFPRAAVALRAALGDDAAVASSFDRIGAALAGRHGEKAVREGCIEPLRNAVLAVRTIATLAQRAKATASTVPDPKRYPPEAAVDGHVETLYWPGSLVEDNREWLQLAWDAPQTIGRVTVRFLKHPSMVGRTIRLQRESAAGTWEELATTVVPDPGAGPHAVATFDLRPPATLDRVRIVNLLDLFEVEAEAPSSSGR